MFTAPPPPLSSQAPDGHSLPVVGTPVSFSTGPFAGYTMRAELVELQGADRARRFGRKDRRPLNPPPIVQVKFYRIHDPDTPMQREELITHYDDVNTLGLVCYADLFPVGMGREADEEQSPRQARSQSPVIPYENLVPAPAPPDGVQVPAPMTIEPNEEQEAPEDWRCTQALIGSRVVIPVCVDHQGHRAAVFVFSDLSVQGAGTFVLRYRVFDIFARAFSPDEHPALAECYGTPFNVYSTKEFPGLLPPTDLMRELAYHGMRLNVHSRERENKRRKTHDEEPPKRVRFVPIAPAAPRVGPSTGEPSSSSMSLDQPHPTYFDGSLSYAQDKGKL